MINLRLTYGLVLLLIMKLGAIPGDKTPGKDNSRITTIRPSKIERSGIKPQGREKVNYRYSGLAIIRSGDSLSRFFAAPPAAVRPQVFWDWMGGMITKEGIRKDLEALSGQGIGGVLVMQMPDQATDGERITFRDYPGKVKCLSDEWFGMVNYAISQTDRLGMSFAMFMCPGWSHAGAPWITPKNGLKKLQSTQLAVTGPTQLDQVLPKAPRLGGPGAGRTESDPATFFYKDIAVVAVPAAGDNKVVAVKDIIDLTSKRDARGRLKWAVPAGSWTIIRLGLASENGINHPAPAEGAGLECDRMDTAAVNLVFNGIIKRISREAKAKGYHSFKAFETDSYEAGYQDFGKDFREQFKLRKGYDCLPWLPVWIDKKQIIGSPELTQRFRNDMSQTISDLTSERFHGQLRHLADENNLIWMTEPYGFMPLDWRTAGSHSAMPGSEFWVEKGEPLHPSSDIDFPGQTIKVGADIAALYGLPVEWAEAFTAESFNSSWRNDPYLLKPWGDAAFCRGVNQVFMHGFTNNAFDDQYQPGVTMGFWGTQMNRHLTWWPYAGAWHRYLARCQFMLRQGRPVNDVLAYPSKIESIAGPAAGAGPYRQVVMNDESLFNRIWVSNGRIMIKGGGSFAAIALAPNTAFKPAALRKLRELVKQGAVLIGQRPLMASPSLENYPACDKEVKMLIDEIWGDIGSGVDNEHALGKGRVCNTVKMAAVMDRLAGGVDVRFNTAIPEDNQSLDFVHRRSGSTEIYFVCNTGDKAKEATADFRVAGMVPEQWDPVTGKTRILSAWQQKDGRTTIPLRFAPRQSFFIVFKNKKGTAQGKTGATMLTVKLIKKISGPWDVSFDPRWGGPKHITFDKLKDWAKRPEEGIKYYSGTAVYTKSFNLDPISTANTSKLYLELGEVYNLARVTLNGKNLGVIWCAPWHVEIPRGTLKQGNNQLTVAVVNTWANRLIGDEQKPDDCEMVNWAPPTARKGSYDVNIDSRRIKDLPDWLINGTPRPKTERFTFSTWRFYDKDAPLLSSGLIGPVSITTVLEK